ncbi:MAG: hypothetical protein MZV63_60485 [Marinilabiliales bacterium]|nr:hypothetical protein [Marinilabiliales bacterium]
MDNSGDLVLRVEDVEIGPGSKKFTHDLVVPVRGCQARVTSICNSLQGRRTLALDEYQFIRQADAAASPAVTTVRGVFCRRHSGRADGHSRIRSCRPGVPHSEVTGLPVPG